MTLSMSLGEYTREIIVEEGAQTTVTGQLPPFLRDWWPWIVAAAVVGGYVYLTREEGHGRPFDEGEHAG